MTRGLFLLLTALIGLYSCGGNDDAPPPAAAALIFPEESSECTTGVSISDLMSRVTFSWTDAARADSYRLTVTNLNAGTSNEYTTEATSFEAALLKGEPYSWSVTSLSDKSSKTRQSEMWHFYNAGEGVESYPPFPARAIYPEMGATALISGGQLTLQWDGTDVDNDIATYDVYFSTANPPAVAVGTSISSESFEVSGLTVATVYYWRIITRDSEGNTSASEVFEFRTVE
ncbi:MAG: fibronectin type III domain-containing protein [Bacteroidota bacterium]